MPTFIDESGDTSHAKVAKPYFRLAAVWVPTEADADGFRAAVRDLRHDLRRKASYEFKFHKTHVRPEERRRFLRAALTFPFRFAACSIDKTSEYWRKASPQELTWAALTSVAVDLRTVYHLAEKPERPLKEPIIIDRNDDQDFLAVARTAFQGMKSRLHPDSPLTDIPRFRKSHIDDMMQLVDMVCGAVGASLDRDRTWFEMIEDRCLGVTLLP